MTGLVRWPLHPVPRTGEALSSWLERTASLYGLTLPQLVEHNLGLGGFTISGSRLSTGRDLLDVDPPAGMLETLDERSGVPVAELRHMTISGWVPWLLDTIDPSRADAFTAFVLGDSVLFEDVRVPQDFLMPVRWRPWLPPEVDVRYRRACPVC